MAISTMLLTAIELTRVSSDVGEWVDGQRKGWCSVYCMDMDAARS
jgi:hypothetical protein